jgi:para-nitrobenzyl esterase
VPRDEAAAFGRIFLTELGLTTRETGELWHLSTAAILDASWSAVTKHARKPRSFRAFEPVLDGELLAEQPQAALAAGNQSETVILAGSTLDEMKLIPVANAEEVANDLPAAVAELVGIDRATAAGVIDAYRRARGLRGESTDPVELYVAIDTDAHFSVPSLRTVQAQSASGGTAFLSLFAWQSPNPELGAFHGVDIPFLFGTYRLPGMESFVGHGAAADEVSSRLQTCWKALLRCEPGATLGEWEPYSDASNGATMVFGGPDTLIRGTTREELLSWDGVII